jgi:hypothetical protein
VVTRGIEAECQQQDRRDGRHDEQHAIAPRVAHPELNDRDEQGQSDPGGGERGSARGGEHGGTFAPDR